MYSALEKLYGLKLFQGTLTEDKIPARYLNNAKEYAKSLNPEVEVFSLVDAIENAEDGTIITLPEDVELNEEVRIKKQIVLNLNGHTISSKQDALMVSSMYGDLTINGPGAVRGGSNGSYTAVYVSKGKCTINDGTYSVGPDENNAGNATIYASGSGSIIINDGEFSTDAAWNNKYYVLNRKDNSESTITVTGGKYYNYNPANSDQNENFVAEGYESVQSETENVWIVQPISTNDSEA